MKIVLVTLPHICVFLAEPAEPSDEYDDRCWDFALDNYYDEDAATFITEASGARDDSYYDDADDSSYDDAPSVDAPPGAPPAVSDPDVSADAAPAPAPAPDDLQPCPFNQTEFEEQQRQFYETYCIIRPTAAPAPGEPPAAPDDLAPLQAGCVIDTLTGEVTCPGDAPVPPAGPPSPSGDEPAPAPDDPDCVSVAPAPSNAPGSSADRVPRNRQCRRRARCVGRGARCHGGRRAQRRCCRSGLKCAVASSTWGKCVPGRVTARALRRRGWRGVKFVGC